MEPMVILNVRIPPSLRTRIDEIVIEERSSIQAVTTMLLYDAIDVRVDRKAELEAERKAERRSERGGRRPTKRPTKKARKK
jgi:hypothetical protein